MNFHIVSHTKDSKKNYNKTFLMHINEGLLKGLDEDFKYFSNNYEYRCFFNDNNIEQKKFKDEISNLKKNGILQEIIEEITKKINTGVLFKSTLHGKHHNERVVFLARIIALYENLPKDYIELLMDAAKYHDIGRVDDGIDECHGVRSSIKIGEVINYKNIEDLMILKHIIMCHSIDDNYGETLLNNSKICNKEKARILLKVLKDADNLDRVRLNTKYHDAHSNITSELNPNFIRTKTAKSMIKLAYELYNYYYRMEIGEICTKELNNRKK